MMLLISYFPIYCDFWSCWFHLVLVACQQLNLCSDWSVEARHQPKNLLLHPIFSKSNPTKYKCSRHREENWETHGVLLKVADKAEPFEANWLGIWLKADIGPFRAISEQSNWEQIYQMGLNAIESYSFKILYQPDKIWQYIGPGNATRKLGADIQNDPFSRQLYCKHPDILIAAWFFLINKIFQLKD